MASPRYTILIANRNTGAVRRLTVKRFPALLFVAGLVSIPAFFGLVGVGMGQATEAELTSLQLANENLRVENDSYRAATGELASQISALQTALTQIGEQTQLDPATRQAMEKLKAMGGPVMAAALPPKATANAVAPNGTFGMLRTVLGALEDSIISVKTKVENQQALARATPTIWPVLGWLSSTYGVRPDPFTGQPDKHYGLDISAERGTPVHATADGTIESAGYSGNYGNCIIISHGFGIATRFGHLSGYAVGLGQKVKRGDVIGYVGATGRATSTHLHYEILLNGQPLDPLRLLTRP
jgi:murein DD-endopeptidase MepM/ murein hydrolase activator NlpD